jgi:hypothetical protein
LVTALGVGAGAEALAVVARVSAEAALVEVEQGLREALPEGLELRGARLLPLGARRRLVTPLWESWLVTVETAERVNGEAVAAACTVDTLGGLVIRREEKEMRLRGRVRWARVVNVSADGRRVTVVLSMGRREGASPSAAQVVEEALARWKAGAVSVVLHSIGRWSEAS